MLVPVTVPRPVPVLVMVSMGGRLKAAVTLLALSIVTVQGSTPVQAPVHPAKVAPVDGVATRLTTVFAA